MGTENSDAFRARATQARRISHNMSSLEGQTELRMMADELDAEADRLDAVEPNDAIPPGVDTPGESA